MCATEIFLWGLREWWVRERQKGFLDETVMNRKDCADGTGCGRQSWLGKLASVILAFLPCSSYTCIAHARECQFMSRCDVLCFFSCS